MRHQSIIAGSRANLGCGFVAPEGWINLDYAVGARAAKVPFAKALLRKFRLIEGDWPSNVVVHNLKKQLPFASQSLSFVYASHVLEHFSRADGLKLLRECFRTIAPGGHLRIVVPDLGQIVEKYTSGELPGEDFIDNLHVLHPEYSSKFKTFLSTFFTFPHKCMYDLTSLSKLVAEAGFTNPEVLEPLKSSEDQIAEVEFLNRTDGALIIEALRGP